MHAIGSKYCVRNCQIYNSIGKLMIFLRCFKKRFCQINPDHSDYKGPSDYPPLSMDLRICAANSFTLPTFEENDKKIMRGLVNR